MKDSEGAYTEGEGEGNAGRGNEAQIDKVARRETETRSPRLGRSGAPGPGHTQREHRGLIQQLGRAARRGMQGIAGADSRSSSRGSPTQ